MKTTEFTLNGTLYHLFFNAAAMFELRDSFGGENLIETIGCDTQDGLRAAVTSAAVLIEQGAAFRRYMKLGETATISADALLAQISPIEAAELKNAVLTTISRGYGIEINDGERDLGLEQLQKKSRAHL